MLLHFQSLLRCIYIYMLFQFRSGDIAISAIPKPLFRIPFTTASLNFLAQLRFISFDAQGYDCICCKFFRWWFQSVRSITSSIVFRRCRVVGSYLKRTHTRSAPYFFVRFLVPRWPGLRIRRVFRSVSCWQCA